MSAARVEWTTVDGRRVRYRYLSPAAGAAPRLDLPLLLIHGLAGSSEVWRPALRSLARRALDRPVIAPDLPGHGRSPGPSRALGMAELAEWTARLLDALAIPETHVAAHSMGCQVALALARCRPARMGGMVLASPTTGRSLMPPWRYLTGMLRASREPLSYRPTALRLYGQMGLRRFVATARKMLEEDPLREIEAVRAPCLVVCGEWDGIIPAAVARALAEALPSGRFLAIPRVAHVVPYHQPAAFTRATLDFLSEARRPSAAP